MRGRTRDLLDMKLISSPLPPPPLSLDPDFLKRLNRRHFMGNSDAGSSRSALGLGWYRYERGRDGKLCIFCFGFSLEGVLRSLPALVSLVSLISFIPLSSLSRIQTHSLRFGNNSSLRLLSSVETSTRPPLSPAPATTTGPPPAPQWAPGKTSA